MFYVRKDGTYYYGDKHKNEDTQVPDRPTEYHIPFMENGTFVEWRICGEQLVHMFTNQVQNHLDTTAQQRNYDNIFTLCGYAGDPNLKFDKEGRAGVAWRSAVWTKCYEILAEVQAGTRTMPTDIISELPVFTWGD